MKSTFSSVSFLSAPDNKDVFYPLVLFNPKDDNVHPPASTFSPEIFERKNYKDVGIQQQNHLSALFSLLEKSFTPSHSWDF